MLNKVDAEAKLKELKRERKRWQNISRSNPWPYVQEYIGVLDRRIAAYEKLIPRARVLETHFNAKTEVYPIEHWNM